MTPGPRDASMLKHMLNGRINSGGHYRPDMAPRGDIHTRSPSSDTSIGGTLPGPLTVRINGVPGGRLPNMSPHMGGGSGSVSPGNSGTTGTSQTTRTTPLDQSRDQSSHITDLSHLSHLSHLSPIPSGDLSRATQKCSPSQGMLLPKWVSFTRSAATSTVCKGALTSLGLLCFTSLLLALLALTFLLELDLKDDARGSKHAAMDPMVREVTLALAALTLALDLCCLLVCSAQFIFALKLVKTEGGEERLIQYLQKLSVSRIFAIGSFFISIPIFLTGVILYTFSQFQRTPAIFTAVMIGIGILVCGLFMIHNVLVWQKEKSKAVCQKNVERGSNARPTLQDLHSSPLPNATLDLSRTSQAHELSTLV